MKRFTTFLMVFVLTALCCFPKQSIYAASADLRFFCGENSVEAGDEFTVYLEITSDVTIGDFETFFEYNAELAEYISGPSCITGADGYLKVADTNASPSVSLRSYVMNFKALKQGICRFKVSGVPMVYSYDNGNSMSVRSELLDLTIHSSANASDDAKLASLRVSPGYLEPMFSPEVYEYDVTVPYDTSKLVVSAVVEEFHAQVEVEGNNDLKVGKNEVRVIVTAENGNTQTYRIYVNVEEEGNELTPTPYVTEVPKKTTDKNEIFAEQEGAKISLYSNTVFRAASDEQWNSLTIPDGYEPDYLLLNGVSVKVLKNQSNADFYLAALVNNAGECYLYRIDVKDCTIQRFVQETVTITANADVDQKADLLLNKTLEYEKYRNQMSLLCGALAVGIAILAIVCIRLFLNSRGFSDDEFDN